MNRTRTDDERALLESVHDDWLREGLSTKIDIIDGKQVTMEFRDGWRVG
jgi:hypothetical protein